MLLLGASRHTNSVLNLVPINRNYKIKVLQALDMILFSRQIIIEPRRMIFQQSGILTSVDSDAPVQPPFKIEISNDIQSVAQQS